MLSFQVETDNTAVSVDRVTAFAAADHNCFLLNVFANNIDSLGFGNI